MERHEVMKTTPELWFLTRAAVLQAVAVVFVAGFLGSRCAVAQAQPLQARIDIDGIKEGIGILVVSQPQGGSGRIASWRTNPEENKQYAVFQMPSVKTQWRKMTFSFMPTKSGKIRIVLKGPWSQIDGIIQRLWIRFDDVSVENSAVENGSFEKTIGDRPHDWGIVKKDGFQPALIQGDKKAHSGTYALEVTHDQCAYQDVEVKADSIVTVTAWHMASPDF
jgi:hypothetical protein